MIHRLLFSLLLIGQLVAQQLPQIHVIGKGEKLQNEFVGSNHVDANGRVCAMIKVVSNMEGFKYDSYNGVVSVEDQPGQDLVFLSPDERILEIYHTGYEPLKIILSEYGIQLHSREVWTIKITGEPQEQNKQSVFFLVQPPVEKITVDGKIYEITNKKPVPLSYGQHHVKIEKRGYQSINQKIQVDKDHVLFNFTLQEVELVPVTINSRPSGAQIFIDGMERGFTSKALNLFPGSYRLRLILSGYVPLEQTIEVRENQTNRFDFTLQKDAGTLVLTVNPPQAKILINKEDYSGKPQIELAPGLYRIEISAEGYYPQSENISIVRGQTLRKNYVLKQKTGKLNFSVSPAEAQVILKRNGRVVKTWQGANYLKDLQVGNYTIEITANGYAPKTKSLTINEQQITSLDVTLKKGSANDQSVNNVLSIDWVWVEGGSFEMGCTSEQSNCDNDEKPVHEVYVDGFYMSKYEVTFAQYDRFCEETGRRKPDDEGWGRGNRPVINVNWNDAVAFCKWLSGKTGTTIRLPTEAEWEYAARGGKKSHGYKYAGSNNVDAVAWYSENSGNKTHLVGQKQPNELGLYDMSGNVWEWCQDWYDKNYYSRSPRNNPKGPSSSAYRVLRGGGWSELQKGLRCSNRYFNFPDKRYYINGFRILMIP